MLKKIAKGILPPVVYSLIRKIIRPTKPYHPSWHTITSGTLKGRELFLDPRDGLWQKEMLDGTFDGFIFEYLSSLNLKGKTVFDIGAQIGFHSMHFAAMVGDKGRVYAFEPNTFNRERMMMIMKKNPDLEQRIKILDVALSDKNGLEDFYFTKDVDGGASSASFIAHAHTYYPKSEQYLGLFEKTRVETITLDDIASRIGKGVVPRVLKIDVEGAESSVLQGGIKSLKKHKPVIMMEVHSIYNMLRSYEILQAAGYKIALLKEELDGRCFVAAESRSR